MSIQSEGEGLLNKFKIAYEKQSAALTAANQRIAELESEKARAENNEESIKSLGRSFDAMRDRAENAGAAFNDLERAYRDCEANRDAS